MPGTLRRNKSLGRIVTLLFVLALILPVSSLALADNSPFRITYEATPEDGTIPVGTEITDEAGLRIPAGPAIDEGSSGENVRSRSDRAGNDVIPEQVDVAASPVDGNTVPRLNEPVLRWLPEIMTSAEKWGVPPEILAGMIRIESQGEPGPISPAGARGLVQMMPDGLLNYGAPESFWHDPATNIDAGAWGLAWRFNAQGSWEGAIGAYLGFGCDAWGTCTDVYIRVVMNWASYYQPIIADPRNSGIPLLPNDWAYGPVAIFQVDLPPDLSEPPTPTATATGEASPTQTPGPRDPTAAPTEPGGQTPEPTDTAPTPEDPSPELPTAEPPTVVPTVPPPPTDVPPPPTEPPVEEPTVAESP